MANMKVPVYHLNTYESLTAIPTDAHLRSYRIVYYNNSSLKQEVIAEIELNKTPDGDFIELYNKVRPERFEAISSLYDITRGWYDE